MQCAVLLKRTRLLVVMCRENERRREGGEGGGRGGKPLAFTPTILALNMSRHQMTETIPLCKEEGVCVWRGGVPQHRRELQPYCPTAVSSFAVPLVPACFQLPCSSLQRQSKSATCCNNWPSRGLQRSRAPFHSTTHPMPPTSAQIRLSGKETQSMAPWRSVREGEGGGGGDSDPATWEAQHAAGCCQDYPKIQPRQAAVEVELGRREIGGVCTNICRVPVGKTTGFGGAPAP